MKSYVYFKFSHWMLILHHLQFCDFCCLHVFAAAIGQGIVSDYIREQNLRFEEGNYPLVPKNRKNIPYCKKKSSQFEQ